MERSFYCAPQKKTRADEFWIMTDLSESPLRWARTSPWAAGFGRVWAAGTGSRSDAGPAACCWWILSSDPPSDSFCSSRRWRQTGDPEESIWFTVIIITHRWATASSQQANDTMTFLGLWSTPIIFHQDLYYFYAPN